MVQIHTLIFANCDSLLADKLQITHSDYHKTREILKSNDSFEEELADKNIVIYMNKTECSTFVIKVKRALGSNVNFDVNMPKFIQKPFRVFINITYDDVQKFIKDQSSLKITYQTLYNNSGVEVLKFDSKEVIPLQQMLFQNPYEKPKTPNSLWNFLQLNDGQLVRIPINNQ
jgi:hypothetical protein